MASRSDRHRSSFAARDRQTAELFDELGEASTPDEADRVVEKIVLLYLDLCTYMACRYDGRGIEHDDLVQVARLALVKAIRRYEPGQAPSFAAYAVPTISGELKRWFRDRGWVVRPPRRVQELRANVQSVRASLQQELGCNPTDDVLAEAVGASVDEIREAAVASRGFQPISLDADCSDDEPSGVAAFLACVDDDLDGAEDRLCLMDALSGLDQDEREILLLRYVAGMTQREIGELRGVSQMRVSRTLRRIITRLHEQMFEPADQSSSDDMEQELSGAS
jgi:RNA polymerase sigma-B factor